VSWWQKLNLSRYKGTKAQRHTQKNLDKLYKLYLLIATLVAMDYAHKPNLIALFFTFAKSL